MADLIVNFKNTLIKNFNSPSYLTLVNLNMSRGHKTTLLNYNKTDCNQLDKLTTLLGKNLLKLPLKINSQLFIHYPTCTVITVTNKSAHLNFFFNIKSLSVITAKNRTNKISLSLQMQPLFHFKFNNDFQTALYVKNLITPWRTANCLSRKMKK